MGVAIYAHELVTLIGDHTNSRSGFCQEEWEEDHQQAHVYAGFECSAAGLQLIRRTKVMGVELSMGACYRLSGRTHDILSMPYVGYGQWREALAALVGTTPEQVWAMTPEERADVPFSLLLNFADNEGTIGPDAAAVLAREFRGHEGKVEGLLEERWRDAYRSWMVGAELAADTGMIRFA